MKLRNYISSGLQPMRPVLGPAYPEAPKNAAKGSLSRNPGDLEAGGPGSGRRPGTAQGGMYHDHLLKQGYQKTGKTYSGGHKYVHPETKKVAVIYENHLANGKGTAIMVHDTKKKLSACTGSVQDDIKRLIHQKGMEPDQAVAVAYKEHGMDSAAISKGAQAEEMERMRAFARTVSKIVTKEKVKA